MGGEPSLSRPGTGPGTEGVPGLSGSESDGDGRSSPGIFSPGMGGEPSLSRPGTTEPGTSPAGAAPVPVPPGCPCARAGVTDPPTRTPIKAAAAIRTIASPLTKIVTPAAGKHPERRHWQRLRASEVPGSWAAEDAPNGETTMDRAAMPAPGRRGAPGRPRQAFAALGQRSVRRSTTFSNSTNAKPASAVAVITSHVVPSRSRVPNSRCIGVQ